MIVLQTKRPEEVWLCRLDVSPWISAGNAPGSVDSIVTSGTAVISEEQVSSGTEVTWKLSGGVSGELTKFHINVTMDDDQVFAESFSVFVA